MDLNLEGKRVLVTGGSKGIGFACAGAFAAEGCSVVIVARDQARLIDASSRITSGSDITTVAADLSLGDERERVARVVGDVDILVNNAGAIVFGDLGTLDIETFRSAWDLKVLGYIHLSKLYLDLMSGRGRGVIVNVVGTAGRAPRADYVCGAAGNAALIAFTEAVGGQSPEWGVRVLGVNPGATATDRFFGNDGFHGDRSSTDDLRAAFPALRVATPSSVADVVVMVASDRASCLSGVVIDCDHGQLRSGRTPLRYSV